MDPQHDMEKTTNNLKVNKSDLLRVLSTKEISQQTMVSEQKSEASRQFEEAFLLFIVTIIANTGLSAVCAAIGREGIRCAGIWRGPVAMAATLTCAGIWATMDRLMGMVEAEGKAKEMEERCRNLEMFVLRLRREGELNDIRKMVTKEMEGKRPTARGGIAKIPAKGWTMLAILAFVGTLTCYAILHVPSSAYASAQSSESNLQLPSFLSFSL